MPRTSVPLSATNSNVVEENLTRAFFELGVDTILINPMPDHQAVSEEVQRGILNDMPRTFRSIQEAELYKTALKLRVLCFNCAYHPHPVNPTNSMTIADWWGEDLSSQAMPFYKSIYHDILLVGAAFEPLWEKVKDDESPDHLAAAGLRLQITAMRLSLLICVQDEAEFDAYNDEFLDIIDLAEYILQRIKPTRHNFRIDTLVVVPLFQTALKCRDYGIRRRAISLLLKYPRREGVWHSEFCGLTAEWIMNLEEKHLEDGKIPGWARIGSITAVRVEEQGAVVLQCVQRTSGLSDQVVTRCLPIRHGKSAAGM